MIGHPEAVGFSEKSRINLGSFARLEVAVDLLLYLGNLRVLYDTGWLGSVAHSVQISTRCP